MNRKTLEMEFHDQRERDRQELSADEYARKYSNKKWYAVTEKSNAFVEQFIIDNCRGKVVLDYCCGLGGLALRLAQAGAAKVYGIDISPESVASSRRLLAEHGLADKAEFQVMDAENMSFEDGKFDVVFCAGVLHHLDVNAAFPEIARVLKADGMVIGIEALGYNPIIQAYRRLTPHLRTAWEVDHILTLREVNLGRRYFDAVQIRFFHLAAIPAVFLRGTVLFKPALAILNAIDEILLRIPLVQRMAWQMVFVLSEPRRSTANARTRSKEELNVGQ